MSFANPDASNIIIQSDRDADLTGLVGNTGVTITEDEGITYYDFGQNRMKITGGLSVDPENEVMIFHHDHQINNDTSFYISGDTRSDGWKYGFSSITTDADGYIVVSFTSDLASAYIVGVSVYMQSVGGDSAGEGRFSSRGHMIKSISSDRRSITFWTKSVGDTLTFGGARCRTYAGFEFGKEYVANGRVKYSKGTGIFITGYSGANWDPRDAGFGGNARTHFRARGGTVVFSKPWSCNSTVDWKNLTILNTHPSFQIEARTFGTGWTSDVSLVNTDIGNFSSLDTVGFKLVNSSMMNTYTTYYELPVRNLDVSENTYDYDYGTSTGDHGHVLLTLTNCSGGTKFRPMWRKTTGTNLQNACEIFKDVKMDVRDTGNTPIGDVKIYSRDYPSIFAKHVAIKSQSPKSNEGPVSITAATPPNVYQPAHGYTTGDCVMLQGFVDSSNISNGDFINGYKKVTAVDADNLTLHYLDGTDVVGTVNHTQALNSNITSIVDTCTYEPENISSITKSTVNSKIELTVSDTTGLTTGDRVYITGVVGGGNLQNSLNNKIHSIHTITSTTIKLQTGFPTSGFNYTSGGTAEGLGKIKLTVSDATGIAAGDSIYVVETQGSAALTTALNGETHTIGSISSSDVVLNTDWPAVSISYTTGGAIEKYFANRLVPAIEYDHTTTRTYSKSTDSSGVTETFPVMIGGSLKEYHPGQKFATRTFGGPYVINLNSNQTAWNDVDTGLGITYPDWDTSSFDDYFRMDRRGVMNNYDDMFKFSFCKYEKLLSSVKTSLENTGTLTVNNVMVDDQTITVDETTASGYTTVDTPEIFYDAAKYWLQQNYTGQHETIVDRQGDTILAKHNHVVVDDQAATVFNYTVNNPIDVTTGATIEFVGTGSPNTNHPVSHLIDNDTTSMLKKWLVNAAGSDTGVIISGLDSCLVTGFKIFSADARSRDPKRIIIYGSNNGTTWTEIIDTPLGSFTNPLGSGFATINNYADGAQHKTLYFDNITRYTSYKVIFPEVVSGTVLAVQELELLGTTIDGTITVNSETFVGNLTTSNGNITLQNDATIVGSYGDISVLPYTLTNIEAGSTIQLYNMETARLGQIVNTTVTGTTGEKVTHTGTYANSLAEPGDEIRLRVTCQSGTTALLPYEVFGVATAAGISFKSNQIEDTIYNNNAIDGSAADFDNTTLDIDPDYVNFELDVSDTDNPGIVTTQQIYAKYAHLITTSEGIDKFFGAITAENGSNYRINTSVVDLKIQNVSASDMIIRGARLYRDNNTTVIVKGPAGAGTLSHDTGEFLQYIQPQVIAAMNEYGVAGPSDFEPIKNNTNLIPGLL